MHKHYSNTDHSICNFVPGFAYYSKMGTNLAEQLVNLIEWVIALRR